MPPKGGPHRTPQARGWCFTTQVTLRYPLRQALQDLRDLSTDVRVEWLCYQQELAPSTGQLHIQGCLWLVNRARFSLVKNLFKGSPHIERARGTPEQNRAYCSKKDGGAVADTFEEFGTMPRQGRRTDLEAVADTIRTDGLPAAIDAHPASFIRYHAGMKALSSVYDEARIPHVRPVKVLVFWGDTGSGKSWAAQHFDSPEHTYSLPYGTSGVWLDGYRGQRTLVLEDFRGSVAPYHVLLNLLDKYKLQAPTKGAHIWPAWDTVIFTSNVSPDCWYKDLAPDGTAQDVWATPLNPDLPSPLERRIHHIIRFFGMHPHSTYLPPKWATGPPKRGDTRVWPLGDGAPDMQGGWMEESAAASAFPPFPVREQDLALFEPLELPPDLPAEQPDEPATDSDYEEFVAATQQQRQL